VLASVSCVSAAACTAVGYHDTSSQAQTLVESWDGTSWSTVPSRNPSVTSLLASVSCASATTCTAAGSHQASKGPYKTLIESGAAR
jgi:hypothetical protein